MYICMEPHPSQLVFCISKSVHAQIAQIDLKCHLNCSYFLLLSGGYVSNSLAIMTDAVHMLTDVVGILFSLLALWLSTKPPTRRFTFGLHRLGKFQISEAFTLLVSTTPFSPLPLSCVKQMDTCGVDAGESCSEKKVSVQQRSCQIRFQIGYFRFSY